jgi:hypothetical protein
MNLVRLHVLQSFTVALYHETEPDLNSCPAFLPRLQPREIRSRAGTHMFSENEILKLVSTYKNSAASLCLFDACLEDTNETNSLILTKISLHEKCNVIFSTQNMFADNHP